MKREVGARMALTVTEPSELVFSVAAAADVPARDELLTFRVDGATVEPEEIVDTHGTRLHRLSAPAGALEMTYEATVVGRAEPESISPTDLIRYLRPSRYCESDTLAPTAFAEFNGLQGSALLDAVSSWVGTRLLYVSGSSQPTDGAVQTLLDRRGVCRDYAHLCVALLRARNVPARLASVYAPGLQPMDFHAVAEAYVDGAWRVVDATALAPRSSLVRIATGRDASDTAFLTTLAGGILLNELQVTAVVDTLPNDDLTLWERIG
ncbi:transglutaminase family protein [Microbacterium sp. LRZ72]|uniref:transglutaminase-like domain-containing protein n=1 Tax=Microbacterium sp. LRZ72 TaxID=2942481 RepID=UPI0029B77F96|nr:transglutaminase family protein [Microbacterium sp. LRZ72]MDX2375983.1 transglutaminase family protein [Microbacterium sp. LRZ72]